MVIGPPRRGTLAVFDIAIAFTGRKTCPNTLVPAKTDACCVGFVVSPPDRERNGGFAVDENPTLSEAVFNAISDWLGTDALATGFLLVTPTVDADDGNSIRVTAPDTQPFHTSLGLIGFAEEYIRDDIRTAFMANFEGDD